MDLMKRKNGIHFYINIKNFDKVVTNEEMTSKSVNHSIHALDTFFSSIEKYGKKKYKDIFTVEKITGARLHMYVTDEILSAYKCVETIAVYAYQLSKLVNKEIPKYKSLTDFQIQIGASYGDFYEFVFQYNNGNLTPYEEITTIGYAANYAAKLQGLASASSICVSEDIYNECKLDDRLFLKCKDKKIEKYGQDCFYKANLNSLAEDVMITAEELDIVKDYANKVNLTDMDFSEVRKNLSFANLSKTNCKKITGVALFADVRGFTAKFKEDDSNLEQMTIETEQLLTEMYNVTSQSHGIHVQFQGDREEVLFQDNEESKCYEVAVLAGMRMIDAIKCKNVHIGIGTDYGTLYAARIGAHGEKDNILIGSTVINADKLEDENAGEDQIAISETIYNGLVDIKSSLVKFFNKDTNGTYIATIGYKDYLSEMASIKHRESTRSKNYNGAWRA